MKYHIWSIEHGAWWGPNHCGYVPSRLQAGEYTEAEAVEVCEGANGYRQPNWPPNEAMVPTDSRLTTQREQVLP